MITPRVTPTLIHTYTHTHRHSHLYTNILQTEPGDRSLPDVSLLHTQPADDF